MVRRLSPLILLFTILVTVNQSDGQSKRRSAIAKKYRDFQIPGRIKVENGNPSGAAVKVINLDQGQAEKEATVSPTGKFDLSLDYFKEYMILISKEGYYDKRIVVSTVVPRDGWERDSIFPPLVVVVTLYEKVPGVKLSFEGEPIGKIAYDGSIDNFEANIFIDDQAIQDEINTALENLSEKGFDQKIAEALEYEKKNELSTAFNVYGEASKIKPSDKFVKEKLKELAAELKNIEAEGKIQDEFDRLMALGNENAGNLNYYEAVQYYKGALKIKANDPVALSKLSDAEKQYALQGEKAKQETEINRLLALGESNFSQAKYPEAINSFKGVLNISPDHAIALSRIVVAEGLLANERSEKERQEADFDRLIALGDDNIAQSKYEGAISNFKDALNIKPDDDITLARLNKAENLLAGVQSAIKKRDEEFVRLVALGDQNVGQSKYADAVTAYKGALAIKPGETTVQERINKAEGLRSVQQAEWAKHDVEFNRYIALGDENIGNAKYEDAITSYNGALNLRPGDAETLARLGKARSLLAAAQTAKRKQDEEFSRLAALGDQNVDQLKYDDATTAFKEALAIKPGEPTVLSKIENIGKLLAKIEADKLNLEAEFNRLVALGVQHFDQSRYADAVSAFKGALAIIPGEKTVLGRIAKAGDLLDKEQTEKAKTHALFERFLEIGDENMKEANYSAAIDRYNSALALIPSDPDAALKLKNAEQQLAKVVADKLKNEENFNRFIALGDEEIGAKNYTGAISNYKKALQIKYSAGLASRIADIDRDIQLAEAERIRSNAENVAMALEQQKNKEVENIFSEKLKIAEENFNKSQWSDARFYYIEALKSKQGDNYATSRVEACDRMISSGINDEKINDYNDKITKADNEMKAKNYSSARFYYRGASEIMGWETYPLQQLKEIDKIIADNLTDSDKKLFADYLNKANKAFDSKEYPSARFYYNKAVEVGQSDFIDSRLKEIESITNGTESKKIDAEYDELVKKGTDAIQQKNSSIARFYFQKANVLKPDENYPKEALRNIDAGQ